jgi:hypothetical protein
MGNSPVGSLNEGGFKYGYITKQLLGDIISDRNRLQYGV